MRAALNAALNAAPNISTRRANGLRSPRSVAAVAVCAAFFAAPFLILSAHAQAPAVQTPATPQTAPAGPIAPATAPNGSAAPAVAPSAPDAAPAQPPTTSDAAPTFSSPPLAIV